MIPRLYDPDEGEVLVDGVNVKEYSLEHLREGVGMVLQKNVLFSGTIRENLMWGDENASEEEVEKAAAAAQALSETLQKAMKQSLDRAVSMYPAVRSRDSVSQEHFLRSRRS